MLNDISGTPPVVPTHPDHAETEEKNQTINTVRNTLQKLSSNEIIVPSVHHSDNTKNVAEFIALLQAQFDINSDEYRFTFQQYLVYLLNPINVGRCDDSSIMVMGDADGSTIRLLIAGIIAGKVTIKPEGIPLLAAILKAEVKAIGERSFETYQTNGELHNKFIQLFDHLSFHQSKRPLYFLGDNEHDRLSCNNDINRKIIENLLQEGAIFIYGNHDSEDHATSGFLDNVTSGKKAYNSALRDELKQHERDIYHAAYFDENTHTLFIHNGLALVEDEQGEEKLLTAFGPVNVTKDITSVVAAIKDAFEKYCDLPEDAAHAAEKALMQPVFKSKATTNQLRAGISTFNPVHRDIDQVARSLNIKIAHGHCFNSVVPKLSGENVPRDINLNSRSMKVGVPYFMQPQDNARFVASAIILGQ